MDRGAWRAAVHGVAKSPTRLSNFTFTFHFHALEKEMATHSGVLARRIPGTGEPGGLPSMGLHTAGHDWSDLAAATAAAHLGAQKWPVMATLDCLYVYFVKLALSSGNSLWSHKELNRTEHVCIHTHTHTHTHTERKYQHGYFNSTALDLLHVLTKLNSPNQTTQSLEIY